MALVAVLPFVGGGEATLTEQILSYVLVLLTVVAFLYGLLVFSGSLGVRELLLSGAVAGSLGVAAAYLGGRPEALLDGLAVQPLVLLYVADLLRMTAAACLGFALARRVDSSGIALLIAILATAADLL